MKGSLNRSVRVASLAAAVAFVLSLFLGTYARALFYRLRSPGLAFAEIVMLWFAILATSIEFWKAVPAAGWLLLPYLAWVSYAAGAQFFNMAVERLIMFATTIGIPH
jgi:tryptophan-rich sensory protein